MTISADQLEWIVAEVVKRLRAETACGCQSNAKPQTAGVMELTERVVTTSTLRNRLEGIASVRVSRRAIVTPAAVDELRERGVTLQRAEK
jgi:hypothetical protein